MPWPVLAVLAAFALGMEACLVYLYLHSLGLHGVAEIIAFFSGIGSLIWPLVAAGVLLKTAVQTQRT